MKRYWKLIPLMLLLCGCVTDISSKFDTKGQDDEGKPVEVFYNKKCGGCHGLDGQPRLSSCPDFTDTEFQKTISDNEISNVILNGKPPRMPGYKDKMDNVEVKELVTFIRAFGKKEDEQGKN